MTDALSNQLNAAVRGSCGRKGSWRVGMPQDVTPTNGCKEIGLTVPLMEHDLVKMETTKSGHHLLLYLGQTDTDAVVQTSLNRGYVSPRPTSYQPPLIQCRSQPPSLSPSSRNMMTSNNIYPMMQPLLSSSSSSSSSISISTSISNGCYLLLLLIYSSLSSFISFNISNNKLTIF